MLTKTTSVLAVLAFAASSSVALACDTSCKKGDSDDKGDSEAIGAEYFEVAGGACGGGGSSCGKDKKGDN